MVAAHNAVDVVDYCLALKNTMHVGTSDVAVADVDADLEDSMLYHYGFRGYNQSADEPLVGHISSYRSC